MTRPAEHHSDARVSVVTAHFFTFEWTELLIRQVLGTVPRERIAEIVIIDQDRTPESKARLAGLDPLVTVKQYEKSEPHFKIMGHDHPWVLNLAMRDVKGDTAVLFDSDAHPTAPGWLEKCETLLEEYDAVMAEDPVKNHLAHPCFMAFRRTALDEPLAFDEGLFDEYQDTGRLLGQRLESRGKKVLILKSSAAFDGEWGHYYLDMVYHHGNGSYAGADSRLTSQVKPLADYYRSLVIEQRQYQLPFSWRFVLRSKRLLRTMLRG